MNPILLDLPLRALSHVFSPRAWHPYCRMLRWSLLSHIGVLSRPYGLPLWFLFYCNMLVNSHIRCRQFMNKSLNAIPCSVCKEGSVLCKREGNETERTDSILNGAKDLVCRAHNSPETHTPLHFMKHPSVFCAILFGKCVFREAHYSSSAWKLECFNGFVKIELKQVSSVQLVP